MRPRLLPVLMFALVATTTVKLGSVWNAFDIQKDWVPLYLLFWLSGDMNLALSNSQRS